MERRYVGIDLHRRRSVIFVMNNAGEKLSCVRIANEPVRLLKEGECPFEWWALRAEVRQ